MTTAPGDRRPRLQDVVEAAERIEPHPPRTPLYQHAPLARELGTDLLG